MFEKLFEITYRYCDVIRKTIEAVLALENAMKWYVQIVCRLNGDTIESILLSCHQLFGRTKGTAHFFYNLFHFFPWCWALLISNVFYPPPDIRIQRYQIRLRTAEPAFLINFLRKSWCPLEEKDSLGKITILQSFILDAELPTMSRKALWLHFFLPMNDRGLWI